MNRIHIEIIILLLIFIGVLILFNNNLIQPLSLNIYVGISALTISIVSLTLSLLFYFKTDNLFKETLKFLSEIRATTRGIQKDMTEMIKQAWAKFIIPEKRKELPAAPAVPIIPTIPTTPDVSPTKIVSSLTAEEQKKVETEFLNYIKSRDKKIAIAFDIILEFDNILGKAKGESRDQIRNNALFTLKNLRDKKLIKWYPHTDEEFPFPDDLVRILL